jgi:hypothetical protein
MFSPYKRSIVRDDSDSDSNDVPLESPCKRMRRVILDDEDEEDDVVERPTRQEPAMEDEHLKSLITCLTASQQSSASALPIIPAELLITLLENVDAAEILDYRLVSSSFRKVIDTNMLYHHIQCVELIGYLGPKEHDLFEHLNAKDYWDLAFVKARFDCLDDKEKGQAM